MKRVCDVVLAAALLVLTLPAWPVIAAAIVLESSGPVFHRSVRVGRGGKPFVLHKFRTMSAGADERGPAITRGGDPRVTRVGAFLRRWKLDELPNLLDVIRGEMSLVGPRPEDPRYVAHYTAEQRRVLAVRPGITSPATYRFRHEEALLRDGVEPERTYVEVVLPAKLGLDLEYVEHQSLRGDARVLVETVMAIFRRPRHPSVAGRGSGS